MRHHYLPNRSTDVLPRVFLSHIGLLSNLSQPFQIRSASSLSPTISINSSSVMPLSAMHITISYMSMSVFIDCVSNPEWALKNILDSRGYIARIVDGMWEWWSSKENLYEMGRFLKRKNITLERNLSGDHNETINSNNDNNSVFGTGICRDAVREQKNGRGRYHSRGHSGGG